MHTVTLHEIDVINSRTQGFLALFSGNHRTCFVNDPFILRHWELLIRTPKSTFNELLQKDCGVTIHTKNLQILLTEMYKTKNELNPSFMQEIFRESTARYNFRGNNEFTQPRVRSVTNGTESVRFKGPQLWQTLPSTMRNSETLCQFKIEIKNWYGENFPCKLCRIFVPNLGYI